MSRLDDAFPLLTDERAMEIAYEAARMPGSGPGYAGYLFKMLCAEQRQHTLGLELERLEKMHDEPIPAPKNPEFSALEQHAYVCGYQIGLSKAFVRLFNMVHGDVVEGGEASVLKQ